MVSLVCFVYCYFHLFTSYISIIMVSVFFCFFCISLWLEWGRFCPYRHAHSFLSNFTISLTFSTYIARFFLFFSDTIFWWIAAICANEYRTLQITMLIDQLKIWHCLILIECECIYFWNSAFTRNWWNAFAKKKEFPLVNIFLQNVDGKFSKLSELCAHT